MCGDWLYTAQTNLYSARVFSPSSSRPSSERGSAEITVSLTTTFAVPWDFTLSLSANCVGTLPQQQQGRPGSNYPAAPGWTSLNSGQRLHDIREEGPPAASPSVHCAAVSTGTTALELAPDEGGAPPPATPNGSVSALHLRVRTGEGGCRCGQCTWRLGGIVGSDLALTPRGTCPCLFAEEMRPCLSENMADNQRKPLLDAWETPMAWTDTNMYTRARAHTQFAMHSTKRCRLSEKSSSVGHQTRQTEHVRHQQADTHTYHSLAAPPCV